MSSAGVPGVNYSLDQLLEEAFNALNAVLNNRYTTNFQRLALKHLVLRYIFQETRLDQLPVQDEYNILHTMSRNLAGGLLWLHARELGWIGVYWGPNGVGVQDVRHPWQVPREETRLLQELESFISQLLQMEASVGEWSELYATVLRDTARSATASGAFVFKPADEVDEVHSEPEDFMRRRRPSKAARRSASLMGRLTEFVNEDEDTKISKREKRKHQQAEAKEKEQTAAEPVEASDERERLSDDSRGGSEGSESGGSGSGEGHECQICGERFARAEQLTDHFSVHEGEFAEPDETSGRPDDDLD